jgi:hypothetical protein
MLWGGHSCPPLLTVLLSLVSIFPHHPNQGCPGFRGFRELGTTNAHAILLVWGSEETRKGTMSAHNLPISQTALPAKRGSPQNCLPLLLAPYDLWSTRPECNRHWDGLTSGQNV